MTTIISEAAAVPYLGRRHSSRIDDTLVNFGRRHSSRVDEGLLGRRHSSRVGEGFYWARIRRKARRDATGSPFANKKVSVDTISSANTDEDSAFDSESYKSLGPVGDQCVTTNKFSQRFRCKSCW